MSQVHARLKRETAAAHERVERDARVMERLRDRAEHAALMAGFYVLHAEVEAAAEPWLKDHPTLDFESRRRTPLLLKSLEALGVAAPAVGESLVAKSPAQALGLLYVVEGATLGGKLIGKSVKASGGDLAGLEFLDPYGDATGDQWRSFLAILDDVDDDDAQAAVEGALQGFRLAEQQLCGAAS